MTAKALACALAAMVIFLSVTGWSHAIRVWWAHRGEWRGIGRNW